MTHSASPSATVQTEMLASPGHRSKARGAQPPAMRSRERGDTGRRRSQTMNASSANRARSTTSTGIALGRTGWASARWRG